MRDVQANSAGAGLYTISPYSAIAHRYTFAFYVVRGIVVYMRKFLSFFIEVVAPVIGILLLAFFVFIWGAVLGMKSIQDDAIKAGVGEYNSTTAEFQFKSQLP